MNVKLSAVVLKGRLFAALHSIRIDPRRGWGMGEGFLDFATFRYSPCEHLMMACSSPKKIGCQKDRASQRIASPHLETHVRIKQGDLVFPFDRILRA